MKRIRTADEVGVNHSVSKLEVSVDWPPGKVGAYIVENDDVILIDAGMPGDEGEIEFEEELDSAGYSKEEIEYILCTHHHTDHIGNVTNILDSIDAEVIAGEGTAEFLKTSRNEDEVREHAKLAGLEGDILEQTVERQTEGMESNISSLPPDEIDRELGNGESIKLSGLDVEAIHTPGHQAHHYCFKFDLPGEKALFSGDALIENFRSVTYQVGFRKGMFEAIEEYYKAYLRLKDREIDRVYPGHGDVFEDAEGAIENGLDSLDSLVDEVEDVVEEIGECTAIDATIGRLDQEDEIHHAVFDTIGSLGYLDKHGRIESKVEDDVRYFYKD